MRPPLFLIVKMDYAIGFLKQRSIEHHDPLSEDIQTILYDIVAEFLSLENDMFCHIFWNETEIRAGIVERDRIKKNFRLILEVQPETQSVSIVFIDVLFNTFPFGFSVLVDLPAKLCPRFFED